MKRKWNVEKNHRKHLTTYEVEDWDILIEEISQGYYRVTLKDKKGRVVSRDGIDPEELLKICKKDMLEIRMIKDDKTNLQ